MQNNGKNGEGLGEREEFSLNLGEDRRRLHAGYWQSGPALTVVSSFDM